MQQLLANTSSFTSIVPCDNGEYNLANDHEIATGVQIIVNKRIYHECDIGIDSPFMKASSIQDAYRYQNKSPKETNERVVINLGDLFNVVHALPLYSKVRSAVAFRLTSSDCEACEHCLVKVHTKRLENPLNYRMKVDSMSYGDKPRLRTYIIDYSTGAIY